ncbi:MAG: glycosyl hydrolase family 8 [Byssovorax sp.]
MILRASCSLVLLSTTLLTACSGSPSAATTGTGGASSTTSTASTSLTSGDGGAGTTASTSGSGGAGGSSGTGGTSTTGAGGGGPTIPAVPFGSHIAPYAAGSALPDVVTAAALDQATSNAYDTWRDKYLKAGCGDGRYYVNTKIDGNNLTVSEGHGYGMMLSAIMAGHDPDAHAHFDGLYRFFRDHPSASSPDLMSWYQDTSCNDAMGNDSASDGDIDIAFALLLADKQWGSCEDIDYKAEGLKVIQAIAAHVLDGSHGYVLLGDWASPGDAKYYNATRSSDFITDHFRSFGAASGAPLWGGLVDSTYGIVKALRDGYSPGKGLLPDFVTSPLSGPKPAPQSFLEGPNDGAYHYNACRDPLRLGTDFLVSGDPRAAAEVNALTGWIEGKTGGDPTKIRAGYQLDGTPSAGSDYPTMAFIAPFGVAAMADGNHKAWLNSLWTTIAAAPAEGYYEDSIRLLSMVVMSGNWWSPESRPVVCAP